MRTLWRVYFYTCAAVLSIWLTILTSSVEETILQEQKRQTQFIEVKYLHQQRQQQSQLQSENGLMIRHYLPLQKQQEHQLRSTIPSRSTNTLSSVTAPWTEVKKNYRNKKSSKANHVLSSQPRSFVFAEIEKLDSEYGVPMSSYDKLQHQKIQGMLESRLCLRSNKQRHSTKKCKSNVEVLKCISCTEQDGTWYTAVSQTGAVFGKVEHEPDDPTDNSSSSSASISIRYPNYNDGPFMYRQLDIAVPIAGQDDKLRRFVKRLGNAVEKFRYGLFGTKITIRVLITRFSFDDPPPETKELEQFRQNLIAVSGLSSNKFADEIVFVPVIDSARNEFSRAKAINALHKAARHTDDSALAVIDVDLSIGTKFLRNALTYPFPQSSAYFPIMFSSYNPQSVDLVDRFIPQSKKWTYSEHHGHWRKFSFGMYVIAGSDAPHLTMNEDFVGWGGEDNDFFARVSVRLNIIRLHETGLTHVWHPKHCDLGGFVEKKYFRQCIASMSHFEGSQLGMYLMYLKEHDKVTFDEIMKAVKADKNDDEEDDAQLDIQKDEQQSEESPTILIGVVSSRDNFGTRVKAIVNTWGDPQNIPEGATIRFFVGAPPPDSEFYGKPEEDLRNLATVAGIEDVTKIIVMEDVVDDEYPPVRKNTAMIAKMDEIVQILEDDSDGPSTFQWIYKVDDDAYVNFDALLPFVHTRNHYIFNVFGERGYGRKEDRIGLKNAGLVKPYCTGGPGYIMSRPTVRKTSPHLKDCVRVADESEYRKYVWHSDTVIGLCIYNATGAGCWDDKDYDSHRVFRHNLRNEDPFLKDSDLLKAVAAHPFKDEESMTRQHDRYLQPESH